MLVVGATGSGKTTTLASLIDYRNHQQTGHILTLEDPIEFVFKNRMSIVNQRQIGTDTVDLRTALKNALRQAPDCILIGEIRDVETMGAAIAYAQSGHLVLATMHANSASHALNRIVSFYSPENRRVLLSDLSTTLKAVVSQRLLRSVGGGRVPAVEVLLNTTHMAELIEQGRMSEIRDALVNSMTPGSQTFEQALIELLLGQQGDQGRRARELRFADQPAVDAGESRELDRRCRQPGRDRRPATALRTPPARRPRRVAPQRSTSSRRRWPPRPARASPRRPAHAARPGRAPAYGSTSAGRHRDGMAARTGAAGPATPARRGGCPGRRTPAAPARRALGPAIAG